MTDEDILSLSYRKNNMNHPSIFIITFCFFLSLSVCPNAVLLKYGLIIIRAHRRLRSLSQEEGDELLLTAVSYARSSILLLFRIIFNFIR